MKLVSYLFLYAVSFKPAKGGMHMKVKLYAGIVIIALLAVSVIVLTYMPGTTGNIVTGNPVAAAGAQDPFFGPEDAEVTIIEYSDFQCPYCASVVPTINQIKEKYGDRVKIVFKDFPLSFHQYAQKAAEAAQCAHEQGRFWEYHDTLFANQGSLGMASLKQYASNLGLNTEQFNRCLDSGKYAAEVQEDFSDGQKAGVSGTPTFFINGKKLVGAQPFSEFERLITDELGSISASEIECDPRSCTQEQNCGRIDCAALVGRSCGCRG
jgi:protein-disulfide isomerase